MLNEETYERMEKERKLQAEHLSEFVEKELGGDIELLSFLTGRSVRTCKKWLNAESQSRDLLLISFSFPEYDAGWLEGKTESNHPNTRELEYVLRPFTTNGNYRLAIRNYCKAKVAFDYYMKDKQEAARARSIQ